MINESMPRVNDVRQWFKSLKERFDHTGECVTDKSGCKMLEVLGASFLADQKSIFGDVNESYVQREIEWYKSMSLNVNDIPGGPPKAWVSSADPEGNINSNYGWMIWNKNNYNQYDNVLAELREKPESRRASMIYTRPSMWHEYNKGGMSDFVCTNAVQFFIRGKKLVCLVQMRSNDVIFGFKNDKAWHDYVHSRLASDLSIPVGQMIWNAGSLHVYERHFGLVG